MRRAIEVGVPDWKPLECVLSPEDCADFMYMGSAGGVVLYKHRDTRRYLNIDAATGRFYQYVDGDYAEISLEQAIEHVYGSKQI
ncbi:MAG: hypothetical protein ABSC48_20005 [Terracidiphilus sp.]|jgi:hypothetical protein